MFLVFEAEEDFLQGAFHYVDHPIVPLDRTVAVLNMDMIGRDEESRHLEHTAPRTTAMA